MFSLALRIVYGGLELYTNARATTTGWYANVALKLAS